MEIKNSGNNILNKMNGLVIFNTSNDVVFQQFNAELYDKIREIGVLQGLILESAVGSKVLDGNIVLQIFSPIINSQRIMHCQFDNPYESFQCENGLNFAFGEFLGFQFIKIGQKPLETLKRQLGVAISLARKFYGPNLFASQASRMQEQLFSQCLECYEEQLWPEEQCFLLEALPRLLINSELKRTVYATLDAAINRLRDLNYHRCHALMYVSHKFVGVSTSKQSLQLSASDLLFMQLLIYALERQNTQSHSSFAVFLQGLAGDPNSGCVPCIAHISRLEKGVVFIQTIEFANLQVASSMYDTFFVLQTIITIQMQGDVDLLRPAYESLESFVKQTLDALKKSKLKGDEIDISIKKFTTKWENIRKMYLDFLKAFERELLVRIESNIPSFVEELKQLFTSTCCDSSAIMLDQLPEVSSVVEGRLLEFAEFLAVKAERNISIEAYLEEFPGLVHFIFVNRTTGMMIAPDLRTNQLVPKHYLWSMIEFTRSYLKKGQATVMWKDKTFHYSYFLWFEDQSGNAVKSVDMQQFFVSAVGGGNPFKSQYEPGILATDYYQQLVEIAFPKAGKLKCYELFCIHLGLVTAACATEHSRRLVATIADVVGDESF